MSNDVNADKQSDATESFFNAKSMVTPGIAGGLTMLFANVLYAQFDLPHKWTGLILSLVFAAIVFFQARSKFWPGILFLPINALVIFSVAAGTNSFGTSVQSTDDSKDDPAAPTVMALVITNRSSTNTIVAPDNVRSPDEVKQWVTRTQPGFKLMNIRNAVLTETKEEQSKQQFFNPWFQPSKNRTPPKTAVRKPAPVRPPANDGDIHR